ncbi:hypothetical protein CDEST_15570 [Colletotrichum destructivum]|uniref:Uncharacterized protein n=1 Tax=Colletotrichum destructivum TaxID=34406 RepID=A0AAX4I0E9_9PEZI|nr:hypothetical protein CDEST_01910 [Colletotrichum destructivum]WQF76926.1 hypothetical protein CDEST_01940 [Colletotrichum destructivum]WQF90556.1 hypothetical protein CDEST_15570 [Colletotrichum destructivum]
MSMPTIIKLRCMHCRKLAELTSTDDLEDANMVQVGYNLFYCFDCAKATGYTEVHGRRSTSA